MKRILLTLVLVAVPVAAAEAQIRLEYSRETSRGRLTFGFSGGHYSGYGYGGGYGSFGPGLVAQVGGGTLTFGVRHRFPCRIGSVGSCRSEKNMWALSLRWHACTSDRGISVKRETSTSTYCKASRTTWK